MAQRAPIGPAPRGLRRDGAAPPALGRKGPPHGTYAALDLGTNNCRLLIARPQGDSFVVVDAFSRIVRLGEGLAASGRLSQPAMDRAVEALALCAEKLRRRNVTLVRSVATEACRRAVNGRAFVDRVLAETGIHLEIISAEQEARLAVTGCQALMEPGSGPALVFDIGGGSTELVLLDDAGGTAEIAEWYSAPWGVVSLSETEPHGAGAEPELRDVYATMRGRVRDAFAPFRETLERRGARAGRLLGTSGTVTTLASLHLQLPSYDRRAIDGLVVPAEALRALSQQLAGMTVAERARLPCIGNERADLVVAGCAILESIIDLWPAERVSVADRGIREGILRGLMAHELEGA